MTQSNFKNSKDENTKANSNSKNSSNEKNNKVVPVSENLTPGGEQVKKIQEDEKSQRMNSIISKESHLNF